MNDKLNPHRFPHMSGKMAAIVGHVLGEDWTEPTIAELVITSDGYVLARNFGHIGFDAFIGLATDLQRNWDNLLRRSRTHWRGAAGSISSLPAGGQEPPLVGERDSRPICDFEHKSHPVSRGLVCDHSLLI